MGSGGTLGGVSRFLKSKSPSIKCYGVEPASANVLWQEKHGVDEGCDTQGHKIQGGGYSRKSVDLPLLDASIIDDFVSVNEDEVLEMARELARVEGIFAGFSTGANLAAAIRLLSTSYKGQNIACVACDSGLKYLSTDLYSPAA